MRATEVARAPGPPVATYSIIASDDESFGAAVQSHWFAVGSVVPWLAPGVGGVVIQSFYDANHGPRGLELLREGRSAEQVLDALLAPDPQREYRQVAVVDGTGSVAAHTGARCVAEAGHTLGLGCSAQANIMERPTVWGAMTSAFEASLGDLAERLITALQAGEAEGGDIRGRQSAAIVVVRREVTDDVAKDRVFDLRVEDHPDPVDELERLIRLRRAYMKLNEGDELVSRHDMEGAFGAYTAAMEIVPDEATNGEAAFWTGIALGAAGRIREAIPYLRRAHDQHPRWAELLPRLPASDILPEDPVLITQLVEGMRGPVDGPTPPAGTPR